MTRDDEIALVHAWVVWRTGACIEDGAYIEFLRREIRNNPRYQREPTFSKYSMCW